MVFNRQKKTSQLAHFSTAPRVDRIRAEKEAPVLVEEKGEKERGRKMTLHMINPLGSSRRRGKMERGEGLSLSLCGGGGKIHSLYPNPDYNEKSTPKEGKVNFFLLN